MDCQWTDGEGISHQNWKLRTIPLGELDQKKAVSENVDGKGVLNPHLENEGSKHNEKVAKPMWDKPFMQPLLVQGFVSALAC